MDINLNVVRGKSTPEGTPGKQTSDAGFSCDTLELQWANNRRGISCILADTYTATIWYSPTLGHEVLRLEDKHGRFDCLEHNGNFAGEAHGEVTQVHGCTEVGRGYGQIKRPGDGQVTQYGILHSVATLAELIQHVKDTIGEDGKISITYSWGAGCAPDDLTDALEVT